MLVMTYARIKLRSVSGFIYSTIPVNALSKVMYCDVHGVSFLGESFSTLGESFSTFGESIGKSREPRLHCHRITNHNSIGNAGKIGSCNEEGAEV